MGKSRDIADSAATINFIDNVTSDVQGQINAIVTDPTLGTLTKTFVTNEQATITLSSAPTGYAYPTLQCIALHAASVVVPEYPG